MTWADGMESVSLEEWTGLLARARPSPFLTPQFLLPWAKAFAAGRPKRIARWERGGAAEGFLFLCHCHEEEGWVLLGGEQVADSLDALVAKGLETEFWDQLLPAASAILDGQPLLLPGLMEGTPSLTVLPPACEKHGFRIRVEEIDRAPFVRLPASFEGYLERLGKKERHELKRKMRRAGEAIPGLSYRVTRTGQELARDFPSFVELHRRSSADKAKFMDDRMAGFFRDVAESFLRTDQLRLAFLSAPGGDIATVFQFEFDGALLLYNSGYDPSLRDIVPGLILISRCIEDAIARGISEYDFLRGRERYKYDLGGVDRAVYKATITAGG